MGKMRLRGHDFGPVLNSSGARGFYGEGYWFHDLWHQLGLDYTGSTFVQKTTTLTARAGNMPLDGVTPKELLPKCIVVKPFKGVVLNSVGLSGPGAAVILEAWGKAPEALPAGPKMLSFMSVAATPAERLVELRGFVNLVQAYLPSKHKLRRDGLACQINLSCPNTGLDPSKLVHEGRQFLVEAERLDMPLLLKINATLPPVLVGEIAAHSGCAGIICSNTIPWGQLPDQIDWKGLFGSPTSPLADLGGGGLSGAPLLPIVAAWITEARTLGVTVPIVGGGGILSAGDVDVMHKAGATAIELGSVSILRPWRVASIIRRAHEVFA